MKNLFKTLCVALIATSVLSFVSCNKDDEDNNSTNQTTNENNIDLTKVNIADNYFYLTEAFCEDWTSEQAQWIQGGLQDGTLYYDLHYAPGDEEDNYKGAEFNLIIEGSCEVNFDVEEYNPATQFLHLSTVEDYYSGTVTLTQDSEKVYMKWVGESNRNGQPAVLEGWQVKSKIK